MRQDPLERLVAPGPVPLGGQRLPEVLLKGSREAGCLGNPLIRPLLRCHRAEKQTQVAALHLLRCRTRRHRMLKILRHPRLSASPVRHGTRAPTLFRVVFWVTLSPSP
jgi:hypothetical protein